MNSFFENRINAYQTQELLDAIELRIAMPVEKRQVLPLYNIIKNLNQNIEEIASQLSLDQLQSMVGKIKIFSQEKLNYYHSSKFGFIKKLFSSLRNAWNLGTFTSSGQLGFDLGSKILEIYYRHQNKSKTSSICQISEENGEKSLSEYFALQKTYVSLCDKTIKSQSDGSLIFSQNLKKLEKKLTEIEEIFLDNPTFEQQKEFNKIKRIFDNLYCMIPVGESVLLKKDLEKIQKLYILPSNEFYTTSSGSEFYEPKVTVKQLSDFFQEFCQRWDYSGIDVSMKTNYYYSTNFNTMVTAITFRKNKGILPHALNTFINFVDQYIDQNRFKSQIKEMICLLKQKDVRKSWGYTQKIIYGIIEEKFPNLQKDIFENFGLFLILFHYKKDEKEFNCV